MAPRFQPRPLGRFDLLLALSLFAACGKGPRASSSVEPSPLPPTDLVSQVSGVFSDAATRAPIASPLDVSITDATGQPFEVLDAVGTRTSTFRVTNGLLTLGLPSSTTLPVHLRIIARGEGLIASSANVDVVEPGAKLFAMSLVNLDASPEGVASTRLPGGMADTEGTIELPVSAQTPLESESSGSTSITIPGGTAVTTSGGDPLQGPLDLSLAYFSAGSSVALDAFPGGLDVSFPDPTTGQSTPSTFVSGGFAVVSIADRAGNQGRRFSSPIQISITAPSGTTSLTTGMPLRAGDQVPLWSYDEVTGNWRSEGVGTAQGPDAHGNFTVTLMTTHLSYFNLDWRLDSCDHSRPVRIDGNPNHLLLDFIVTSKVPGYLRKELHAQAGSDPNELVLAKAPRGLPVQIEAFLHGMPVGNLDIDDLCGPGALTLGVNLPAAPARLVLTAREICPENHQARPAAFAAVVLLPVPSPPGGLGARSAMTDTSGQVAFDGLAAGGTFNARVENRRAPGTFVSRTVTLMPGDQALDVDILLDRCQQAGGGGGMGGGGFPGGMGGASPPPGMCAPPGAMCAPMSPPCCMPSFCNGGSCRPPSDGGLPPPMCLPPGNACSATSPPCCMPSFCNGGSCRPPSDGGLPPPMCLPPGNACSATSPPCCMPNLCNGGSCRPPSDGGLPPPMCLPPGNACSATSPPCCMPNLCNGGSCRPPSDGGLPPPMCLPPGNACSATSPPCCMPNLCNGGSCRPPSDGGLPPPMCLPPGNACSATSPPCCMPNLCNGGSCRPPADGGTAPMCLPPGNACSATSGPCCMPNLCNGGSCRPPADGGAAPMCLPPGNACSATSPPCCMPNRCNGGSCRPPADGGTAPMCLPAGNACSATSPPCCMPNLCNGGSCRPPADGGTAPMCLPAGNACSATSPPCCMPALCNTGVCR